VENNNATAATYCLLLQQKQQQQQQHVIYTCPCNSFAMLWCVKKHLSIIIIKKLQITGTQQR